MNMGWAAVVLLLVELLLLHALMEEFVKRQVQQLIKWPLARVYPIKS